MSNTYANLKFHLLFNTQDRRPLITSKVQDELYRYIGGIIRRQQGNLIEIGGQTDHVHLLLGIHQDRAVSEIVRLIKANSSKWLRGTDISFTWERGYAGFTVSESEVPRVRRFIQSQEIFHKKVSCEDEFRRLVELHGLRLDAPDSQLRRHTYTTLRYHVVFGTKQRLPLIVSSIQDKLYETINGLVGEGRGQLLEIGGISDHVHLLLDMRPDLVISNLLQSVKGQSSVWMGENGHPESFFGWQRGYGVFSVSESHVSTLRRYIQRQEEHHRTQSFAEEFRHLLKQHGLELRQDGSVKQRT